MARKILLTGAPGVGKTTVIKKVAAALGAHASGFYTEEVRQANARTGFDIITLDGRRTVLSRKGLKSRHMVGKYGVDLQGIDAIAVSAIEDAVSNKKTLIIDEIGKMELFSEAFRHSVLRAFDFPNALVAVIMLKPNPFADAIKRDYGARMIEVTPANRDSLPPKILSELGFRVK